MWLWFRKPISSCPLQPAPTEDFGEVRSDFGQVIGASGSQVEQALVTSRTPLDFFLRLEVGLKSCAADQSHSALRQKH
jgi:hypothetical protein